MSSPSRLRLVFAVGCCLGYGLSFAAAADPSDAETLQLIETLAAADATQREQAADRLVHRVAPTVAALPGLTRLAEHADPRVRLQTALALGQLLPASELKTNADRVAFNEAQLLAAEVLNRLHKDTAPAVRAAAVRSVAALPPTPNITSELLRDSDAGVRLEAVRVLIGRTGVHGGRIALLEALGDADAAVRREAAAVLGQASDRDPSILPKLHALVRDDPSPSVRAAARASIEQVEPNTAPSLTPRGTAIDQLARRWLITVPALTVLVLVGVWCLPFALRTRLLLAVLVLLWTLTTLLGWRLAPTPLLPRFTIPQERGFHFAGFSPDGERFALLRAEPSTAAPGAFVDLINRAGRTTRLEGNLESVRDPLVQFSSDGSRVLVLRQRREPFVSVVHLHDVATGRQLADWEGSPERGHPCFTADLRRIAFSRTGNPSRVWDTEANRWVSEFEGLGVPVAFSPNGRGLLSGLAGNRCGAPGEGPPSVLWDADTGTRRVTLLALRGCAGWQFSPDGDLLLGLDPTTQGAELWETSTGRMRCHLEGSSLQHQFTFSPEGRYVVGRLGVGDSSLAVWDVRTGGRRLGVGRVTGYAFTPDGQSLICCHVIPGPEVTTLTEYDLATLTPREIGQFRPTGSAGVYLVGPTANGSVAITEAGMVRILDRQTGAEQGRIRNIASVHASPDGRTLVVSAWPTTAYGQTDVSVYDVSSPTGMMLGSLGLTPVWTLLGSGSLCGLVYGVGTLRTRARHRAEADQTRKSEERFERLLQRGRTEALFQYLEQHPERTPEQLVAVLRLDQAERWQRRQPRFVADYLREHPEIAANPTLILQLMLGEYEASRLAGIPRALEDVSAGFPELLDLVRQRTAADATLLTDPLPIHPVMSQTLERSRLLEQLEPPLRIIAAWHEERVGVVQIASRLGCAVCTIERKLALIRRQEKVIAELQIESRPQRNWFPPVAIATTAVVLLVLTAWW